MKSLDDELAELGVTGAATAPEPPPEPDPPLKLVQPGAVHPMAEQWSRWRDAFAQAMDGSFYTIEGLEQLVFQGKVQFWPGKTAALVTEIQTYVGGEKAIQGLWAAGDLREVLEMIPGVEAFGRLMGCTSSLVEGRAGWTKPLKALGYANWSVTLKKAL